MFPLKMGGGLWARHSRQYIFTKGRFRTASSILSISDNCVRESTLWFRGKSFVFLLGRPGLDFQPGRVNIFSFALLCYGYNIVRLLFA